MPTFIDLLCGEISRKASLLRQLWSRAPTNEGELELFKRVKATWLPNPALELPPLKRAFAVDGSMIERSFNNAASVFIGQALLIGPDIEEKALRLEVYRGTLDRATMDRLNSIYLRELEVSLALKYIEEMENGVLFLDGSLYSMLPHILYPVARSGQPASPDPAFDLLKKILLLLKKAEELKVTVLCLSKTSNDVLLSRKLILSKDEEDIPEEELSSSKAEVLPDAELLFRSTNDAGFSRPLIVGKMSFYPRHAALFTDQRELIKRFAIEEEEASDLLAELWNSPAHGVFYWRPTANDDPIRVDFPWMLYVEKVPLRQVFAIFADDISRLHPVLSIIQNFYGGTNVYNALLWQADKAVRLTKEKADIYLSVLNSKLGERVRLDRSSRRFF